MKTHTKVAKHCIRCGQPEGDVEFRSDDAIRCTECDIAAKRDRKVYTRIYHRARSRATSRLIEAHKDEFEDLFDEELTEERGYARGAA